MNTLNVYPLPNGAIEQKDFLIRARALGTKNWKDLSAYQVHVDMHDIREASMVYFDFEGEVEIEITFPKFFTVYDVQIRPLSLGITADFEAEKISFILDRPVNLSVEINKDRFHNLHLFAGAIEEKPAINENTLVNIIGNNSNEEIIAMPKGRLIYIEPGIHYISSFIWQIPSDTRVYLAPGAILMGGLEIDHAENIEIFGRGVIYQWHLPIEYYTNGLTIDHSSQVKVSGITFINPLHYTISFGQSTDIQVENVKTFSCHGWTDGFDMMSSKNIIINHCFLRTSDDCIAIYGSRWKAKGDSRNIIVKNTTLWADVAHPMMIGTHGDHEGDGDIIEDVLFENIDVLEHHEFQPGYLGVMALNAGDKNTIKNITYRNIRIEPFEHGKVFDLRVFWNKRYNPAPGREIRDIHFEGIYLHTGCGEESATIEGYSPEHLVKNVTIKNYYRDGVKVTNFDDANITVGQFIENINIE